MNHRCPVCGYPGLEEKPRTSAGGGSFEICPSCGFQFGVTDDDRGFTYEQWREFWRAEGLPWSSQQPEPANWDPEQQLEQIRE